MLLSALVAVALSATVVPQSVEQLTDKSTHVVRATVARRQSAREPGPAGIYTRTTLSVVETLKGKPAPQLVVRQAGGKVGSAEVELVGDAELREGEQVLAFLSCQPAADHCTLVGLAQGKYHLESDPRGAIQATRDFSKTSFVGGPAPSASAVPYGFLAARVRARAHGAAK